MGASGSDVGKIREASDAFKMAKELDTDGGNSNLINKETERLKSLLEQGAATDYKNKNYKMAASKFYAAYTISPQDTLFLFNAAIASKIEKDFDTAEIYFETLGDLEYTGMQKAICLQFNKETGKDEPFVSKSSRDLMVKAGNSCENRWRKMSESKRELVLLSLADIYMSKGKNKEAIAVIKKVRENNPKDMNLIQVEADMVYSPRKYRAITMS